MNNSPQGVNIEVEGSPETLEAFLTRLVSEKPPISYIQSLEPTYLDPIGYAAFEIRPSVDDGTRSALIMPDLATCPDCLNDIFDPSNRRYLYPFTNCTNCGPRFSIVESLPYDRPNTTMKRFPMCRECREEYENPLNRRFHAQPNACAKCGPHLELWSPTGALLASHHNALLDAVAAVKAGGIVAVKGLGGFLLMADARRDDVVMLLRERKHRQEKPFALMFPSLAQIEEECEVSEAEARLLGSPESPIVLLKRRHAPAGLASVLVSRATSSIAPSVAPNSPILGVMLPYTPLHHLLMSEVGFPLVATSGNLSDEPICTDEQEALERLAGVADLFLVHDRPIARHMDDSIVRILMGREMILRRARGYAPLPVRLSSPIEPALGTGAHLKNSVAFSVGQDVFISQHIGDLETTQANEAFKKVINDLQKLYQVKPSTVACDMHPDYLSTRYAEAMRLPVRKVQHHIAHVYACMAENGITGPALGVCWDGTGYGEDGTAWGGEFFHVPGKLSHAHNESEYRHVKKYDRVYETNGADWVERIAHLRTFCLPGGDKAAREPRRAAISLLYSLFGDDFASLAGRRHETLPALAACTGEELATWVAMIKKGVNAPLTSSAGRLFDAVASLLGIRHIANFEGQAAMELEYAIKDTKTGEHYNFQITHKHNSREGSPFVVDWAYAIHDLLYDLHIGTSMATISTRFHNTLAEMIVEVAQLAMEEQVVLTGGCFQNAYLAERTVTRLREEGFRPYWHQRVPPNDGGIALGQVVATSWDSAVTLSQPGQSEG